MSTGQNEESNTIASGGYRFAYREEHPDVTPRSFALLVDLSWSQGIGVERQGLENDGPWGVDVELQTHQGAASPARARELAHALLAAADLAEQFEAAGQEPPRELAAR